MNDLSKSIMETLISDKFHGIYHSTRKAVEIGAQQLPKEYKEKAHHIDKLYNSVTDDQIGPAEAKLFGGGQLGVVFQSLNNMLIREGHEPLQVSRGCFQ